MEPLKEGEIICPVCNGKGYVCDKDENNCEDQKDCFVCPSCRKCGGTGKLDWLETIFGKQSDGFIHIFTRPTRPIEYIKINVKLTKNGIISEDKEEKWNH
jgi:hypothetical protein